MQTRAHHILTDFRARVERRGEIPVAAAFLPLVSFSVLHRFAGLDSSREGAGERLPELNSCSGSTGVSLGAFRLREAKIAEGAGVGKERASCSGIPDGVHMDILRSGFIGVVGGEEGAGFWVTLGPRLGESGSHCAGVPGVARRSLPMGCEKLASELSNPLSRLVPDIVAGRRQ
jgi:hypothetical protein